MKQSKRRFKIHQKKVIFLPNSRSRVRPKLQQQQKFIQEKFIKIIECKCKDTTSDQGSCRVTDTRRRPGTTGEIPPPESHAQSIHYWPPPQTDTVLNSSWLPSRALTNPYHSVIL